MPNFSADLSAIPTHYDGYHFRSRAEARWAIFFNALRVEYEYEPQGWRLPNGTLYLPDFYLPEVRVELGKLKECFLEIKGLVQDKDVEKCRELAYGYGCPVYLATGTPWKQQITRFTPEGTAAPDCKIGYQYGTLTISPSAPDASKVKDAFQEAKSSRFEHGESPDV